MANAKLSIPYDSEKLEALQQFIKKEELEQLLLMQIDKIYVKKVPVTIQKYLQNKNSNG